MLENSDDQLSGLLNERTDGKFISLKAKSDNHSHGMSRYKGLMPEILSLIDVGNMHFDYWSRHPFYSIPYAHGCMGIGRGIENDAICREAEFLDFRNDLPFNVRLEVFEFNGGIPLFQCLEIRLESCIPVDIGLTFAQKIEIGSVDYGDFHSGFLGSTVPKNSINLQISADDPN